jgi:biopolymer transport protein ExbB
MLLTVLLQITEGISDSVSTASAALPAVQTAPVQHDSLSLLDLIMKGGMLMIPIGILSLISIYVLIERFAAIRKAGKSDSTLMQQIKEHLRSGNIDAAKNLCKAQNTAVASIMEKGVSRIGKPIREIESSMESVGKLEISKMEKGLSVLGIIAGIAPMFGFIGTISGVIKIFYNISLADNISIGLISGGLYEKMITSAAGLIVGVFSFVSYHYLNMMIDRITFKMEAHSVEFLDILQDPKA